MKAKKFNITFLKAKFIFLLLLTIVSQNIVAQYYQIKKFTVEDGLPSNMATGIFQDSKGYIWLKSGYEKFCRYDGKKFTKYSNINGINIEDGFFEDSLGIIHTGNLVFSNGKFIKQKNDTIRHVNTIYSIDGGAMQAENSGFLDKWGGNWKMGLDGFIYRNINGKNIKITELHGLPPKFYERIKSSKIIRLNIYSDKNKNIWINSNLGTYFFNGKKIEFSGIKLDNVYAEKDSKSRIWIRLYDGSSDDVYLFQNDKLIHFDKKQLGINSFGWNLLEDKKGNVWCTAGNDGLMVYRNNKFEKIHVSGDFITKGLNQKGNLILLNTIDKCIYELNGENLEKIISLKNYHIGEYDQVFVDREDNIWIGSENGLFLVAKSNVGYTPFSEYKNFDILKKDIRHLFTSSKGKIYLFNYQRGIYLLEKDSLVSVINDPDIYPEDVLEDNDGKIWITSRSIAEGHFYKIYKIHNNTCDIIDPNSLKKLCDTKKIGNWPKLLLNKSGNISLASGHLGVFEFNKDNKCSFYQLPDSKSENFYGQLIKDFKKQDAAFIYTIASKTKLVAFDEMTKTFDEIIDQNEKLPNYFIGSYFLDNKFLFFGSKEGLYILQNKKIKKIAYSASLKLLELWSEIWIDSKGHLWYLAGDIKSLGAGGAFVGLNEIYFDVDGKLCSKFYDENSGLSSNSISSIFIKDYPNIWMAAGGLLNKLNINTGKIEIYDYKTFGGDNSLNTLENSENTLYSFSTAGIVKIDYLFKTKNTISPLVDITEVGYEYIVEGQKRVVKKWEYDFPINLELAYKENNVFFEVRGLSFTETSKVHYKYILEGYDKNWSDSTTNTFIKYTNLPEGHYTLKVLASNNSNVWSETPASFTFTVLSPWYRTWIAYIFYIIVTVGSVYTFIKSRTRKLEKEKERLEKTVEERTQEVVKEKIIVVEQKHLIEEKHKEITDSINYAERIQRSFLATKEQLDKNLKDYFVLYQPKDIVSGDFYWASKLKNGNFALVTADSTGHGVPGAIMSLLNTSSLEKAVELGISEPSEILNHTRGTIIARLKNDGSVDGGKDQFGGPNGKKFMYKKLKDILISISNKIPTEQKDILTNILKEWMGNIEQVDDITIIGIRI